MDGYMDVYKSIWADGWIAQRTEDNDKQVGFQEVVTYEFR